MITPGWIYGIRQSTCIFLLQLIQNWCSLKSLIMFRPWTHLISIKRWPIFHVPSFQSFWSSQSFGNHFISIIWQSSTPLVLSAVFHIWVDFKAYQSLCCSQIRSTSLRYRL
jgi:hypothetical protein